MRRGSFAYLSIFLTLALVALAGSWARNPEPGHAGIGGGVNNIIVTTTEDENDTNPARCSLREAIASANQNLNVGGCSRQDRNFPDSITFDLAGSPPRINIVAGLPTLHITAPVVIDGGPGRVEVRGPGVNALLVDGLAVSGANTTIRNLIINRFPGNGISVNAPGVRLSGNFIGTDAAGNTIMANGFSGVGTSANADNLIIGGTAGTTPSGSCSGECNVISGNPTGILSNDLGLSNIQVLGNFIGLDVTGVKGLPNGIGISVSGSGTIGNGTPAGRNVVSGNTNVGIEQLVGIIDVRGNYIGVDSAGTSAQPNGGMGLRMSDAAGRLIEDNVISGNGAGGMVLEGDSGDSTIQGNLIGTAADGTTPAPNGGHGILIDQQEVSAIGGFGPGEANVIAHNVGDGVRATGATTTSVVVRGNSIHSNGGKGIAMLNGANNNQPTPVITSISPIGGTSCANCDIDVYSDNAGQGRVYEGTAIAGASGTWTFQGSVSGPNVTAVSTDPTNDTSEFSAPVALPATPTPSPTSTASPTPTKTATPTPSPTAAGSLTPTATAAPTATTTPDGSASVTAAPSATPFIVRLDLNCDDTIDEEDAFFLLAFVADLTDGNQAAPCPDLGEIAAGAPWGDVNCDDVVDEQDVLALLAFAAGVNVGPLPTNC